MNIKDVDLKGIMEDTRVIYERYRNFMNICYDGEDEFCEELLALLKENYDRLDNFVKSAKYEVGDLVRVISTTDNDDEWIKIGSLCVVKDVGYEKDTYKYTYDILEVGDDTPFVYYGDEIEKVEHEDIKIDDFVVVVKEVGALPIGTVCKVISVEYDSDKNEDFYVLKALNRKDCDLKYWCYEEKIKKIK